ncbi:MAG: DUF427 domain-containing protein [Hyphomicrobiales bacterium]|nr:DUF427 domain-containing protein [Hyphomicrobiales bacterium]
MTDIEAAAPDGAIRRPDKPQHFMMLKPIGQHVRVYVGKTLIADTAEAVYVLETFNKVYDPVIYVTGADIAVALSRLEKSTHCPLKGDASYYALNGEEIGWAYQTPFDFSQAIRGYHAFRPEKVRIEIGN